MQRRRETKSLEVFANTPRTSKFSRPRLSPKSRLVLLVSTVVLVALVVGISMWPKISPPGSSPVSASESSLAAMDPNLDSDGDGIPDQVELAGWKVNDGSLFHTDPFESDTDDDGLSDREEAGDLVSATDGVQVYVGLSMPTSRDSDDDGLEDYAETYGWTVESGEKYFTNPLKADGDDDGLLDSDEAGDLVSGAISAAVYSGYSNPGASDTDADGLVDSLEADSSSDPLAADTDADGLTDLLEVTRVGSDPTTSDTDGDGFGDGSEVDLRALKGLDPLFEDVEVSTWEYASEFAKGALAGEAMPSDSLGWLAGNLTSTGSSFVPGVGWIVGGAADIRDAVAQAIRTDWVGASYSAVGLIANVGDAMAISRKVGNFIGAHPALAAKVAMLVLVLNYVPESTKIDIARKIWTNWESLVGSGASEEELLKTQTSGRINLDSLDAAMNRARHVPGAPSTFLEDSTAAENLLADSLRSDGQDVQLRVREPTENCPNACTSSVRILDSLSGGTAHEAKVGYVRLTPTVRQQISSDAYLLESGRITGAQWHFYPSAQNFQLGASDDVFDLLEEKGINYTVHVPAQ